MIRDIAVDSYRSIRKLQLALTPVTVVLGPNGCGKTNLYRSLYLLGAAAGGRLARTIAEEGGMPSALWAGGRKKGPVRMTIRVDFDDFVLPARLRAAHGRLWLGLPPGPPSDDSDDSEDPGT